MCQRIIATLTRCTMKTLRINLLNKRMITRRDYTRKIASLENKYQSCYMDIESTVSVQHWMYRVTTCKYPDQGKIIEIIVAQLSSKQFITSHRYFADIHVTSISVLAMRKSMSTGISVILLSWRLRQSPLSEWKIVGRVSMLFSMVFNGTKTDSSVVQWEIKRKGGQANGRGRGR
jgi:hypothetical protein